ncbi:RagB/SusD family nutrient uptake outer membrane protein [Cyclobacterium sp.]|uniref:RagB/SusD family nutrient uptake outer membrane protein n=1 Tax=Cyclobacterium sp. TaxID=1966343 RepID=UPI0019CA0932|nr:RagB/SusD family nutrient uptake outer membrane protein [Cyclobacterium sp.]MBD3629613.1 RagB/SusD family nutrient uptake outer membrane protein [Cyclobacterium sp.]
MKNTIKLIGFTIAVLIGSCTDLQEQILDESLSGGGQESDLVRGVVAPAYGMLPEFYRHTRYFAVQEITTDEAILPYRGGRDWGDNGIYLELHQHTWGPVHSNIQQCWDYLTVMISRTVTAINILTPLAESDSEARVFLAEVRGLRAFYNMIVLDLWGITFRKDDAGALSEILRGNDAVEYIRTEFEAVVPDLRTDVGPGRLTKGGVYGLLARLHLNAAVWRDPYADSFNFTEADMIKVIDYTNMVINDGQYSLSPEFFANFNNDNHNNPELVFAVDQRPDLNGHNRMSYFSMSDNFYGNPLFPRGNGTDGPGITPDWYQSWEQAYGDTDPAEADARFYWERMVIPADSAIAAEDFEVNRGIYRGLQYGLQNTGRRLPFIQTTDGRYKIGPLRDWRRAEENAFVDFTEEINFTAEGSDYNTGFRVEKYQWSKSSDDGRNKGEADLVILRLADCYLMRAEAKLRMGDTGGALSDVNLVRASRTARPAVTPPPLGSMDLDLLFRERGFEFYWEHQRRTDMIRFGKYEDSWTEKTDSDVQKRIFPIPQSAIDGASAAEGYLVQNPGY